MIIVCLGDSLTYGYEVKRSATWPGLAARMTGKTVRNKGVNGIMTAGMLSLFARDVIGEGADTVMLMGGANDILSGLSPTKPERAMTEMVKRAHDAGITPLVGIPVPFCPPIREDWAEQTDFAALGPLYDAYAEQLRGIAASLHCVAVDFRSGMAAHLARTNADPRSFYLDGIHLNEAGHSLFADIFVQTLHGLEQASPTAGPQQYDTGTQ